MSARPPRARGVIGLDEAKCTVCMLCVRECPDWCIEIDSHVETLPADEEHRRPRSTNVLDRFAIDYALCMYCGICVEVCPFDALHWAPVAEYAGTERPALVHEGDRLAEWETHAPAPPELDERAVPVDPGPRRR
jgi:NADH-quinone oxidoreductase subunit I